MEKEQIGIGDEVHTEASRELFDGVTFLDILLRRYGNKLEEVLIFMDTRAR